MSEIISKREVSVRLRGFSTTSRWTCDLRHGRGGGGDPLNALAIAACTSWFLKLLYTKSCCS